MSHFCGELTFFGTIFHLYVIFGVKLPLSCGEKCQRKSKEVTESLKGHIGQLEVKENYFIGFELSIGEQNSNQSELDPGQKLAE